MSIFAISFIILGHVSSVGKLFIAVFVQLIFGCFQSNWLKSHWKFEKSSKFHFSPCRTIECSTAEGVTPRARAGYGSEVVNFFVSKNKFCQ